MDVAGGLSLVQTILQLLDSAVWKEIQSVLGVKSQLKQLKETMSTIDAILHDAEEQERLHHSRSNYTERNRLERLKEALYQADDLFDEVTTLAHRKKLMPGNNLSKEVSLFFSQFNQLRSAVDWSREINSIRERLDDVVKDHQLAGWFRHSAVLEDSWVRNNPRETHSYVNLENDVIIGRDDDKRFLIDLLLGTTVEENVSVVSIVGIGGLGKTTLAQLIFNDNKIKKEFPLKMWVCVSDSFNVKALAGQILAAATNQANQSDGLTMEQLQIKLREVLDMNKYLLVLDDVWNQNSEEWRKLKTLLVGGGKGSRILVTMRSKQVAVVVGSCWTHELKGLSDEDSWNLFQRMTLEPGQHQIEANLVDIGKEIVRKCANVPLVIRVVGSLLRGQDESKWQNLKNNDLANIIQDEATGIVPVLKISYNYLPFHLKSCFSYCAVFPKDYKIIKEDLICLWMAQGFIMPSNGDSFEDVGDKYFEQLQQRCFFQDVELAEGTTNEIISCKMHDLIHDLAKEVAGTDILSCTYSTQCFNEKTRHVLFVDRNTPKDVVGKLSNMQRMRTFLCTEDFGFSLKPFVGGVSKVKYLRVLRLNHCYRLKELPSGIGELVHLRYLDLSYNSNLCVLPSSITKLNNLQTLKLRGCWDLKRLPRELRKLVNLRHLDIYGCEGLTCMPPGMNSMASLRNLTGFVVSGSATSNAVWGWRSTGVGQLEDLDDFTNYTRTMEIVVRKNVRYDAVGGGMLLKSPKLCYISYEWKTKEIYNAEVLLQGLQPHSNLRELELQCYPGAGLPTWMMSQLRHLKVLAFKDLSEVEYMESSSINSGDDDELVFFPSLEKLKLENMPKLKGWWKPSLSESGESDRIPQAPVLSELYVSKCPNLTTLFLGASMNLSCCLPNLVQIEICDCQRLEHLPLMSQLRHLKVLLLKGLSEVEYMESSSNINSGDDDELVFFPSLEKLELKNMPKLKGWWKPSSSESGESDRIPQAPVLSELYVSDCPNLTTLFLGASMKLKSCLPNLAEIVIRDCKRLEHLPLMSQLRHLKVLSLDGLSEVEYMESSSINSGDDDELVFFPSLERLMLWDMPKLKGWWKSSSESEESETPQAPKLSSLFIEGCPELTTFPLCPGLQKLVWYDLNEALGPIMRETTDGLSVSNNNHKEGRLRAVRTDNVGYLTSLPIHSFHYLSKLHIWNDQKVEELKTGEVGEVFRSGRLSSLRSLDIWCCKNLKSISGRGVWEQFTVLETLRLVSLPELELEDEDDVINNKSTEEGCINNNNEGSDAEMPWRYLAPTLRSLCLNRLPKAVKLPRGIGCLSSLQFLSIYECYNLETLPPSIGGLSSLHSLNTIFCPKLKTMPKEMRHLTSLTKLNIWGCSPELMKECKNKNGANWSNIQHIPNIQLEDLI